MATTESSEPGAAKRERSPSFPVLDLGASLELLNKLYKSVKMNETRIADVALAWSMSLSSGHFLRNISALIQFGLIEGTGSNETRKFRVSNSGRRILEDDRPGVRERLMSEAALQPKLIRGLFLGADGLHHWAKDRPDDAFAESYLKFELQFSAEAAKRFLGVYDATIAYIQVQKEVAVEELTPSDTIVQPTKIEVETPEALAIDAKGPSTLSTNKLTIPEAQSALPLNQIIFKSEGDGIISISATLDATGLDALAKKIEAFKMLLS